MSPHLLADNVTTDELGASVAVQSLIILLLASFTLRNLVKLARGGEGNRSCRRVSTTVVLAVLLVPMARTYNLEIRLLLAPQYATGTTLGFCQAFARGKGIEFQYEVDGASYTNCSTFHPRKIDEIKVPKGRYRVRYSQQYPGKGRMDFGEPIQ
jgi:hypothetical protein